MRNVWGYCVVIFAAVVFAVAAAASATAGEVAEALPRDTLVYVEIPNVQAFRAGNDTSAYGKILGEESVRNFLEKGFPALDSLEELVKEHTGNSVAEILEHCKGRVAFALVGDERSVVGGVLVVEVGEEAEEFEGWIGEAAGRLPLEWAEVEIPGATAMVGRRADGGDKGELCYTFAGEAFVACTSLGELERTAAGLVSGRVESLSGSEEFRRAMSVAGVEQPEAFVYLGYADAMGMLLEEAPANIAAVLRQLGLDSLGSMVYWSRRAGDGVVDTISMHFPEGRKGVFLSPGSSGEDYRRVMSMAPEEVISASWTHADLGVFYDAVAAALETALPPTAVEDLSGGLREFEGEVGFGIRADLVGSLGKNILSYQPMPSGTPGMGLAGGMGQQVMMVELADEARFAEALAAYWMKLKETGKDIEIPMPAGTPLEGGGRLSFIETPFDETTIYETRLAVGMMFQVAPAMAVSDGWLVVGMNAQAVKNALSGKEKHVASVLESADYTSAARFAGPGNASASYCRTKVAFENLYTMASVMMPFALMRFGEAAPIDQFLMPAAADISQHLFGSAMAVNVTDDSIRMTEFGPVGAVRTLSSIGTIAAAVGSWAVQTQQRERAGVGRPQEKNDLKMLGLGLLMYSNDHEGDFPQELSTLAEEGYLGTGADVDVSRFFYVRGLRDDDAPMLLVALSRRIGDQGRPALFVDGHVEHLSESEVAEQVGGWLELPEEPGADELRAACEKNLGELGRSVGKYAKYHDGLVPEKLERNVDYRFAPLVTTCPANDSPDGSDYLTVAGLDISSVGEDARKDVVLVYEREAFLDGTTGVGFLDGSIRRLDGDELRNALAFTNDIQPGAQR